MKLPHGQVRRIFKEVLRRAWLRDYRRRRYWSDPERFRREARERSNVKRSTPEGRAAERAKVKAWQQSPAGVAWRRRYQKARLEVHREESRAAYHALSPDEKRKRNAKSTATAKRRRKTDPAFAAAYRRKVREYQRKRYAADPEWRRRRIESATQSARQNIDRKRKTGRAYARRQRIKEFMEAVSAAEEGIK